ncbi:MAG: hypothetical protein HY619_03035 [Thaumarchaeota archaeon]|nr:hypothetical protein [Nitrososphaerota archaeon]
MEEPEKDHNLLGLYAHTGTDLNATVLPTIIEWLTKLKRLVMTRQATLPTDEVLVVATAVFRDLQRSNAAFLANVEKAVDQALRAPVHILDGFVEAQLLTAAIRPKLPENETRVIFDLGAGSLEIVLLLPDSTHFTSLPLGAGRITALVMQGHSLSKVMESIKREFAEKCELVEHFAPEVWYGVGGVAAAFQKVFGRKAEDSVWRDEIKNAFDSFTREVFEPDEGSLKPSMRKDEFRTLIEAAPLELGKHRRLVYVGGLLVTECMCRHFKIHAIRRHGEDLRCGLLTFLDTIRPSAQSS